MDSILQEFEEQKEIQKSIYENLINKVKRAKDELSEKNEELSQIKKEIAELKTKNQKYANVIRKSNEIVRIFANQRNQ